MRISDWSSDVCSSDLCAFHGIALDNPAILGLPEVGVVTQQRSPHQLAQHWVYHRIDVGRAQAEGADGLVSHAVDRKGAARGRDGTNGQDRKSTRLNSSH